MSVNILALVSSLIVVTSVGAQTTDDTCPAPSPCTCRDDTDPMTGNPIYVIDCDNGDLVSVPAFTNYRGKSIDKIILSNNRIENISETAFSAFSGQVVKGLDLSFNRLQGVHVNAFSPIKESLVVLNLQDNGFDLSSLPWAFLAATSKLKELNLEGNYRFANKMLPENAFQNLPNLQKIDLSRSYLKSLHPSSFNGSPNIEKISLYGNSLTEVPVDALRGLSKLRELDLDSNSIAVIPANAFDSLDSLEYLILSRLDLFQPDAIHQDAFIGIGDSLKRLSFYRSYLSVVPHLAPLHTLTDLDLTYNDITEFPPNALSALVNLTTLEISGNPLNFTTDMFLGLEDRLETILIRQLPATYKNSLPLEALKTLKKLQWIDASDNGWTRLTRETIAGLDVKRLTLMWMDINYIAPDAFDDMKTYRGSLVIGLDTNNISDVSWMDPVIFQDVDLQNNPVHCTCQLYRVISLGVNWRFPDGTCSTPSIYQGLSLRDDFPNEAPVHCGKMPAAGCDRTPYMSSAGRMPLYSGPLTAMAWVLYHLFLSQRW